MRVDRISINKNLFRGPGRLPEDDVTSAVPVYIETTFGNQLVGHRVISGTLQGHILTTEKYVVLPHNIDNEELDHETAEEVGEMINHWLDSTSELSAADDRYQFALRLISYIKNK